MPVANPKLVKLKVCSYWVDCPECGEGVASPGVGSLYWTMDELREYAGQTRQCTCGAQVKIPNKVRE